MKKGLLLLVMLGLLISLASCASTLLGGPEDGNKQDYLYRIVQEGKWGFMNQEGEVVIKPFIASRPDVVSVMKELKFPLTTYETTGETITIFGTFLNNPVMLQKVDDLQTRDIFGFYYDYLASNVVLNRKQLSVGKFSDGLAPACIKEKWGYIDTQGELAIEPRYDAALPFSDGYGLVKEKDRWKFITPQGVNRFGRDFEEAYPFHDGYARFRNAKQWSYLYKSGDVLLDAQMAWTGDFSEGLAIAKMGNKTAYIDTQGKVVIQANFLKGGSFKDGLAPVQDATTRKWGYINRSGIWVVPAQYDDAELFSGHHGAVLLERAYGFVNDAGAQVVEPQYNAVGLFAEGLAPVKQGKRWGYIDKTGEMVILPQYEWAYSFDHGLAAVETEDGIGYINPKGEYIWKPSK